MGSNGSSYCSIARTLCYSNGSTYTYGEIRRRSVNDSEERSTRITAKESFTSDGNICDSRKVQKDRIAVAASRRLFGRFDAFSFIQSSLPPRQFHGKWNINDGSIKITKAARKRDGGNERHEIWNFIHRIGVFRIYVSRFADRYTASRGVRPTSELPYGRYRHSRLLFG